jgi:hypothetical protein
MSKHSPTDTSQGELLQVDAPMCIIGPTGFEPKNNALTNNALTRSISGRCALTPCIRQQFIGLEEIDEYSNFRISELQQPPHP